MVINMENRIFINPVTKEQEFSVSSDSFFDDLVFIEKNEIKTVSVGKTYFDWSKSYLLKNLKSITGVNFGEGTSNLLDLSFFSFLESISINGTKGIVNFDGLHSLKKLFLIYQKGILNLNHLKKLVELQLNNCRDKKFNWHENFCGLVNLEILELTDCYLPSNLSFLEPLVNLKKLEIYLNPKPFHLQGLRQCEKLERLILSQCPHLQKFEDIKSLKSLKWLRITDSGPLSDCSFVNSLPKLEVLIVTGKSYFLDGDLSPLVGKLKHISIDNKKHYSHKMQDFPSIFRK